MGSARGALAKQRGNREALAGADFKRGVLAAARVAALALHPPLFDDVKVLHGTFVGMQDRLALRIEAQLAVFHQAQQMALLHAIEWRVLLQELDGALNILQDRSLACFGKGICLAHGASGVLLWVGMDGLPWPSGVSGVYCAGHHAKTA